VKESFEFSQSVDILGFMVIPLKSLGGEGFDINTLNEVPTLQDIDRRS
jgi:hypothetical protein